jgi:hypothetical protein
MLIKLYSFQDLIIYNGLMNFPKSNWITCIRRLVSNVVGYVISDMHLYNQIVNFDVLNDLEPDFDHKPLNLTLNLVMHKIPIEENSDNKKHLIFDINKLIFF